MATISLSDGTKLRTSSTRQYVTFRIADDSTVDIFRRTDDRNVARGNHSRARRHACRTVTVDFGAFGRGVVPQVLWDD